MSDGVQSVDVPQPRIAWRSLGRQGKPSVGPNGTVGRPCHNEVKATFFGGLILVGRRSIRRRAAAADCVEKLGETRKTFGRERKGDRG